MDECPPVATNGGDLRSRVALIEQSLHMVGRFGHELTLYVAALYDPDTSIDEMRDEALEGLRELEALFAKLRDSFPEPT